MQVTIETNPRAMCSPSQTFRAEYERDDALELFVKLESWSRIAALPRITPRRQAQKNACAVCDAALVGKTER
jgi:hypothetical protein